MRWTKQTYYVWLGLKIWLKCDMNEINALIELSDDKKLPRYQPGTRSRQSLDNDLGECKSSKEGWMKHDSQEGRDTPFIASEVLREVERNLTCWKGKTHIYKNWNWKLWSYKEGWTKFDSLEGRDHTFIISEFETARDLRKFEQNSTHKKAKHTYIKSQLELQSFKEAWTKLNSREGRGKPI